MQSQPPCLFLLAVVVACGKAERGAAPRLGCARVDSVEAGALWYSDAAYGMAGRTEGGTRVAVYPETAGWRLMLEPVGSDVPNGSMGWPYGADPETLQISWRDPLAGKGVVFPRDTTSAGGWVRERVDSIALSIRCDTLVLSPWGARRQGDAMRLIRRLDPAF